MPLKPEIESEYWALYRAHANVLLFPNNYDYKEADDIFVDHTDKHAWHDGAKVRRLHELNEMRKAP